MSELRSELEEKSKIWEELKNTVENIKILRSKEKELAEYRGRKEKLEKDKVELEKAVSDMEKELDSLSKALENLEKIVDDSHIQKLIDSLSIGDTCPVCGNIITVLPKRLEKKRI